MRQVWGCGFLVLGMLISMGTSITQQVIYVSASTGVVGEDAGTPDRPYRNIGDALAKAVADGVQEIRVTEGSYKIEKELYIPQDIRVIGGYKAGLEIRWPEAAMKTILIGNQLNRVVRVAGTLEGVTVSDGFSRGGNGGGVYVEATGKVMNCIIKDCKAAYLFPKVGDLYLKDGTFLDVNEFTSDRWQEVKGIVFWVNPDKNAVGGKRGFVVAPDYREVDWSSSGGKTLPVFYSTIISAIGDKEGRKNTDILLQQDCNFAKVARQKGAEWSVPALGQIMMIGTEWAVLDHSFRVLWEKMRKGCTFEQMQQFYGTIVDAGEVYEKAQHFMRAMMQYYSSTLVSTTKVWALGNFSQDDTGVESYSQRNRGALLYVTEF